MSITIQGYEFRTDVLYDHRLQTWVKQEGRGLITLGITDFWTKLLGGLFETSIKKPTIQLLRGHPFGVLKSRTQVDLLYSPVNGQLVELNGNFDSSRSYDWIARARVLDWGLESGKFLNVGDARGKIEETINTTLRDIAQKLASCCG